MRGEGSVCFQVSTSSQKKYMLRVDLQNGVLGSR